MSVKIVFRLGDTVPSNETIAVGEPVFSPTKYRMGLGAGGTTLLWYPGLDQTNQDMIMYEGSMIRSEAGGTNARAGFEGKDQFSVYTDNGLQLSISDCLVTVGSPMAITAGGTLAGDFNTDGGEFTNINMQKLSISPTTAEISIVDEAGAKIGSITHDGVTSKSQTFAYTAIAANNEAMANWLRTSYSSGFVAARSFDSARPFDNKYKNNMGGQSAMNMHAHSQWNGVCGLGEISALVNGYSVTSRQTDYRIMCAVPGMAFGDRQAVVAPQVPDAVLAMPTGFTNTQLNTGSLAGTQAGFMQNIYQTNPELCVFYLSYLEVWVEAYNGTLVDNATSPKHIYNTENFASVLSQYTAYLRSGFKPLVENLPLLPGIIAGADPITGQPIIGYINYRISSVPVGTLSTQNTELNLPLATVDIITGQNANQTDYTWQLLAMPYDPVKAAAGVVDSTNVWKLKREIHQRWWSNRLGRTNDILRGGGSISEDLLYQERPWLDIAENDPSAIFSNVKLEQACRMCPGFDGVGNYALRQTRDPNLAVRAGVKVYQTAGNSNGLNYYSNAYVLNTVDSMGNAGQGRGFNDNNLFTASTAFPEVLGGYTFMIPLELVLRTPRESWNPFGIAYQQTLSGDGKDPTKLFNGNPGVPYNGWNDYGGYYKFPTGVLTVPANAPAGTKADNILKKFINTSVGPVQFEGSGIANFERDGYRRRFCVTPDAHQFSSVGRDLAWLKFQLKNLLKGIASGRLQGSDIDDAF